MTSAQVAVPSAQPLDFAEAGLTIQIGRAPAVLTGAVKVTAWLML
jgi:hypothetical protein